MKRPVSYEKKHPNRTIPLFKVHVPTTSALSLVKQVFDSGFINEGVQVTELTRALSERWATDRLCLTNSCTSALTMAMRLAGVGNGDEVVSTPMTCVATNTPVVNLGARVVWADVDPSTGMIDPRSVASRITPRTKAVVAVAWAGNPPDLSGLMNECSKRGVRLILDAAHAFDARWQGDHVHAFADYTCYSFQAIKHFTTGDGGALVCARYDDHARAKAMKWFGLDRDKAKDAQGNWKGQQWDADIAEAGFKFNMNNVSAAIGLSQLPHIDGLVAAHRRNAALYDGLLWDYHVRPIRRDARALSSHWVYAARIDPATYRLTRDELLAALSSQGIMAGLVHVPNDAYSAFAGSLTNLPGVRDFASNQLCLPCGWWMSEADVRHVARCVIEAGAR